jgi:hypothetical protein
LSFSLYRSFTSFVKFIPRYLIFLDAIASEIIFLYSLSICSLLVYRKAADFCKFILLKLFMVSRSFGVEFFESFRYKSYNVQIGIMWLFLYVFLLLLFSLPALLLWLGILKTMLNKSEKNGHSCNFLDFMGNSFIFSPLSVMLAVSL